MTQPTTEEVPTTRTLEIDIKTRNGRRKTESFSISQEEATDPIKRAAAIGIYSLRATNRFANSRVVNWRII